MKKILMINLFTLIWILPSLSQIITTDIQYNSKEQTLELTIENHTDYNVYIISPIYNDVYKNTIWYTAFDYKGDQIYKHYSVAITDKDGNIRSLYPIAPKRSIKTKHCIKDLLQDRFHNTKTLAIEWFLRYGSEEPILIQEKKNIGTVIIKKEFELLKD